MKSVSIVDTGVGNLESLRACMRRLDFEPISIQTAEEVRDAQRLVLPGVGAFSAAMEKLRQRGLVQALKLRVEQNSPTLAICLGMQVLATNSEESAECLGLDVISATAESFPATVPVPQIGWNRVSSSTACRLLQCGDAYFANSFRWRSSDPFAVELAKQGWCLATANHGGEFVAAVERGAVLACQFHPELSGEWGQELVNRWLQKGAESC